jgi:prepilin signal peptidase PulO-like enzyme (type II secretory pathway)
MSLTPLLGKLLAAFGFVLGVGGGAALGAAMRGASVSRGRLCPACRSSLSPVAAIPFLSWWAIRPTCRGCRRAVPRGAALLELGVVASGVAAILLLPLKGAVMLAGGLWALLLVWLMLRRR